MSQDAWYGHLIPGLLSHQAVKHLIPLTVTFNNSVHAYSAQGGNGPPFILEKK